MKTPTYPYFGLYARQVFLALTFIVVLNAKSEESAGSKVAVTVRNEMTHDVVLSWEVGVEDERHEVGMTKSHGGESTFESFPGHIFSYLSGNERHFVEIPAGVSDPYLVLNGNKPEILVRCATTVAGKKDANRILDILVMPHWSPRGAARFLELVRNKHYNGVALNRVVGGYLTQFGIPADPELRAKIRDMPIRDDPKLDISFIPGMISFAGSGPDSRTSEVFIVAPDSAYLSSFGNEPWETPFGIVGNVEDSVISEWYEYGDLPPDGSGPDPQKIYAADGYEYLAKNFPKMDYINECVVMKDYNDEL